MDTDPLSEGLLYEASLPFQWHRLEAVPDVSERLQASERGEAVLQAINVIEGHHQADLSDEYSAVSQEINRIDAKVDLLLDLMSQLLSHQKILPQAHAVRFGASGLAWLNTVPTGLEPGCHVATDIYLQPRYPSALRLSGEVVSLQSGTGDEWVTLVYHSLSPALHDGLDRLIFRHHRRSVALVKGEQS